MQNIAILAGGYSPEYQISLNSAQEISSALDKTKYKTFTVVVTRDQWFVENSGQQYPIDREDFTFRQKDKKVKFDCVLMAIHGTPGEDGKMQAYFDMLNLPYTSCGFFSSAIGFNKFACKSFLAEFNVATAPAVLIRKGEKIDPHKVSEATGFPCFVKPNNSGSSFGISRVPAPDSFIQAVEEAFMEGDEVIVEKEITGIEISCGLIKTKKEMHIFPLTEIVSHKDFFDYEAKYSEGMADEITPARLDETLTEEIKALSSGIYDHLNCHGIVRIDYILSGDKPWFLEINTVPGMSAESIIPKQIAVYGNSVGRILDLVIEDSISRLKS